MRILVFLIGSFMLLALISCSNKKATANKILEPAKMQAVLWDYFQVEAYTEHFLKKDSTKKVKIENALLQQKVFDIHKISREQFNKSYDYYSANAYLMRPLLDSIIYRAESKRTVIMSKKYGNHPVTE